MSFLKSRNTKTWIAVGLFSALTTQALADGKDLLGTLIGGVIGGVVGSNVGDGDAGAAIVGAVIGAAVGHEIGESMDEADKREAERALNDSLNGPLHRPTRWDGERRSGNYGSFESTREFRSFEGYMCRTYVSETWFRGQLHRREGQMCRYPDGSWRSYEAETVSDHRHRRRSMPVEAVQPCRILGYGGHEGFLWNYRVAVGYDVVFGTQHYDVAQRRAERLRRSGACY